MTKTAQEFIQSSFSPLVATLCSPKVETIVSKNNLSLVELLQPFASLEWEGQFREPGGTVCLVKNVKLVIRDVNWKPLPPTEARRQLNNAVLYNYDNKTIKLNTESNKLEIPQATPWFDAWRETYFEVQFPSDHEFTKHFLSCIIVGTTQDDNLIDTYNVLNQKYAQLQNVTPPKLPKWFNNSVLKTYLLLNDASIVPKERADQAFETLKQSFGAGNCYMLTINSKTHADPKLPNDYWIQYIKRPVDANQEMSSSLTNLSAGLLESLSNIQNNAPEQQNPQVSSTVEESAHPLTDNEAYDNGNSLQTYSFSGSSESVNLSGKQVDRSSEVHGAALNMADIEAIKRFLIDYTSQALIPHVEKQIGQLNEVVANKKGVSRSLLSATKRWFTTGKAGNTTVNNTVIYSSDCPELQLRRLGDLWLLFGQWARAYDAYHTAKREFYADSAWLCYAGALEMAAISAFIAGEANRKTFAYMDESITTYLNTCRMVQYAVRATLLSVPCLISAGLYGEAAKQLIRMTSEDSDLRSAMLLEQAALCFLKGPSNKIMTRKYAFHIVLAGHRFSKAGQKKHAYRCYNQAYQVYAASGWRLSSDHVEFALGRLAGALRLSAAAAHWLAAPLAPAPRQNARQQDAFLREFMSAHQQWVDSCDEFKEQLPVLPVPLLICEETAVLCTGPAPLSTPGRTPATSVSLPPHDACANDEPYWHKLEETLLQVARGCVPMIFKPTTDLYTQKTDCHPVASQGEPLQISITLYNPLKVALQLKDLELLWQFTPKEEQEEIPSTELLHNETGLASGELADKYAIHGQKLKSVLVEGESKKILTFTLTPLRTGRLTIQGLALRLLNGSGTKEVSTTTVDKGVAIFGKLNLQSTGSGSDKLFHITIIPHAPCLQMTFSEIDTDVISGEIKTVDVEFRNVTSVDIKNLHLATSHPDCMSIVASDDRDDFRNLFNDKYRQPPEYSDERAARAAARAGTAARCALRVSGAHARLSLRVLACAPDLYLLAYYETGLSERPYRLIRHVFRFTPREIVKVYVTPRRGLSTIDDKVLENMRLAVEVKNVCNEKEDNITTVEVLEASLLSRQWKLVDYTAAVQQDNCLNSRERIHFVLKGVRILSELPGSKVDYSSVKMSRHHPESNPDIDMPPYSKFVTDTLLTVTDSVESTMQQVDKSGLIRSMFVLRWKSSNKNTGRTAVGQHCLWLDCFTKAVSRDRKQTYTNQTVEPTASTLDLLDGKIDGKGRNEKNNVVVFKVDHSNIVDHNFNKNKICMIPVKINVVNCYGTAVTVFIDLTKQQNRDYSGLGWVGALNSGLDDDSKQVGVKVTLEKFESRSLQVRALCAAPGTYQVGSSFAVTTTMGPDSRGTTHFVNNTSLLVVKQTA